MAKGGDEDMLHFKSGWSFGIILGCVLGVVFSISCSRQNQPSPKEEIIKPELVLIPGGRFLMGKEGTGDHSPVHQVYIDSFYLDKYEVTNAQYWAFCTATEHRLPEYWGMEEFHCGLDYPNHPAVGVSWSDAQAYAEWAGKRLPTEAEWEYAARGSLVGMDYPNGAELDSTMAKYFIQGAARGTVPVGSYTPNGYGLHDMAGNVVEWVFDYYDENYYETSPAENPTGPEKGKFRVIRGGGWHSGPSCNRTYFRNALRGSWVDINVGFRCARNLPDSTGR